MAADEIVGLVLGAGMSSRMGQLKQLLPLAGEPALRRVARQAMEALPKVIVVLGYRAAEVRPALAGLEVEVVVNQAYANGMTSSVQCGMRAAGSARGFIVCLGDQPSLQRATIGRVVAGARESGRGLVIPTYKGRRGHPIFLGCGYLEAVLALLPEQGLNQVTRGYPADTLEVEVEEAEILDDMDTPADYKREVERHRSA